ncbi:MAG: 2-oxoglutarate dehydrogenase E1 component, partial [Candidatus Dormibacteraeota bacterium]|nr:2-oxoglutarate dehydrogenase E1 component [Candidatus Dormibacteraeota bacterium]
TVIEDPGAATRRGAIRTLLLCSGHVYYDLQLNEARGAADDIAIARVELLHPFPANAVGRLIESYPNLERLYWVQEEPSNMGAWGHVSLHLRKRTEGPRVQYIGRPRRASPSEGFAGSHRLEQERIVTEALGKPVAISS